MSLSTQEADLFEGARGRLQAIAYRMLGSAGDAEDVVQEVFLRWHAADRDRIETTEAWLTKVLTNLCLNQLASARVRRETYVGQWLPEPVPAGDPMLGPAETTEQRESVSLAMLTVLERLAPNERVVYVLREAFGYTHREIAEILELTESNCQQIYRRARQHVGDGRSRTEVDTAAARRIAEEFLAAALSGDTGSLIRVLSGDVVAVADGGGRIPARKTPVLGAPAVARYLAGLFRPTAARRAYIGGEPMFYAVVVNGDPAVLVEVGERVFGVFGLEMDAAGVAAVHVQVNPEKLAHLARRWTAAGGEPPLDIRW
ncbi:RNA polymerase sigma-70 factor [Nocardia jinanensis]|uniref:DNA-directed RNA polymerase sigma-70 factor n=1 Tax=Nocardia jinanensis TaxID=382504 RepID=A0A917VSD4_9NOCA|nr:RNA polymerase sigma-70 factor [Nocardia jinanensis]GGL09551.1 DNA-directed RNA polymerase sigma-70 factor [Nocardia jinanensis]